MAKESLEIQAVRLKVLEDYGNDNPKPKDLDDWCARESERYVVPESAVRNIIAKKIESLEIQISATRSTSHQKIADALGASTARAIRTVLAGLEAKRKIIKGDPDKGFKEWDVPDWDARINSAREIFKIRGAYAPEKLEVSVDELGNLSNAELDQRIAAAVVVWDQFKKRAGSADRGAAGEMVSGRPLLLDDGGDTDEGRARLAESVQAVPQEAVPAGVREAGSESK